MDRFVGAPLEMFEQLLADGALANIPDATYPPGCWAASGPLRFRRLARNAIAVDVRRCAMRDGAHFRLELLFSRGTVTFGGADDLARFWNETVADAFGLPRGGVPEAGDDHPATPVRAVPPRNGCRGAPSKRKPRQLSARALAKSLDEAVRGQHPATAAVSSLVSIQLAKRAPARPATALLLGPSGVGKTRLAEALPGVLDELGRPARLHRINCNELTHPWDTHAVVESWPEYPRSDAPRQQAFASVVLLDDFDRAHPAVQRFFYGVLDRGRLTVARADAAGASHPIVVLTSSADADSLGARLHRLAPGNYLANDREARAHLVDCGWPSELVARIDTIALFRPAGTDGSARLVDGVVVELAGEYGLVLDRIPRLLREAILDSVAEPGATARGIYHAARRLLGPCFVAAVAEGLAGDVKVDVGPPPVVRSRSR